MSGTLLDEDDHANTPFTPAEREGLILSAPVPGRRVTSLVQLRPGRGEL
jgi:hypothetical protein